MERKIVKLSDFTIADEGDDGWVKISVGPTSGQLVSVLKSIMWGFLHPEDPADKGKFEVKSKSGNPIDGKGKSPWSDSFKANGFLVKAANRTSLLKVITSTIEEENEAIQYAIEDRKQAAINKIENAASNREAAKAKREDTKAKYGNAPSRVKTRQVGGDDGYQYMVFVDGRAVIKGLTRSEATFYVNQEIDRLAKKEKMGKYAV